MFKYVNIIRVWGGFYVEIFDYNVVIGRINEIDEFYIVVGFSGYGFMFVLVVGEVLVEFIVDGKIDKLFDFYDFNFFFNILMEIFINFFSVV